MRKYKENAVIPGRKLTLGVQSLVGVVFEDFRTLHPYLPDVFQHNREMSEAFQDLHKLLNEAFSGVSYPGVERISFSIGASLGEGYHVRGSYGEDREILLIIHPALSMFGTSYGFSTFEKLLTRTLIHEILHGAQTERVGRWIPYTTRRSEDAHELMADAHSTYLELRESFSPQKVIEKLQHTSQFHLRVFSRTYNAEYCLMSLEKRKQFIKYIVAYAQEELE